MLQNKVNRHPVASSCKVSHVTGAVENCEDLHQRLLKHRLPSQHLTDSNVLNLWSSFRSAAGESEYKECWNWPLGWRHSWSPEEKWRPSPLLQDCSEVAWRWGLLCKCEPMWKRDAKTGVLTGQHQPAEIWRLKDTNILLKRKKKKKSGECLRSS